MCCRLARVALVRQALDGLQGALSASTSGLTLSLAASRRHGAQVRPGCSLPAQPVERCFRPGQLGRRSLAPPRVPYLWAAAVDPAPGESGSSRPPAARAQRPWRSPSTNGPQDRLCPGSPQRMAAMVLISPLPQFGQCCLSMSKTRLSSRAQLTRCGRAWTVSTSHSPVAVASVAACA